MWFVPTLHKMYWVYSHIHWLQEKNPNSLFVNLTTMKKQRIIFPLYQQIFRAVGITWKLHISFRWLLYGMDIHPFWTHHSEHTFLNTPFWTNVRNCHFAFIYWLNINLHRTLEAATAVVELLMMDVMTSETCWAVSKRQVINGRDCCIWLVDLFELYDDAQTCKL